MSLAAFSKRLDAWQESTWSTIMQLLLQARAQLITVQTRPNADERIDKMEELLNAQLEPIFLQKEMELEPIQQGVEAALGNMESPTDADYAVQERAGNIAYQVRERAARKVTSLMAQARAQELLPTAPGAPVPQASQAAPPQAQQPPRSRFCGECGATLTDADHARGTCPSCREPIVD